MSGKLRHRGADPEDERAFSLSARPTLRQATSDLCWLLDRGYALPSAAELVGNRYKLAVRQRLALGRCAGSRQDVETRAAKEVAATALPAQELWIDALNVITALETALAGGYILIGVDGCCRDVAGVHRRYHKVEETAQAIQLVGACTAEWGVAKCVWWIDSPVANSGRLKKALGEAAAAAGWNWQVELVLNPDRELSRTSHIVATADRMILNKAQRWFNLVRTVLKTRVPAARVLDLSLRDAGAPS